MGLFHKPRSTILILLVAVGLFTGIESAVTCQSNLPFLHYQQYVNFALTHPGVVAIGQPTDKACADSCSQWNSFSCIAFNFNKDNLICTLLRYSRVSVGTNGVQYQAAGNANMAYYEAFCNSVNDKLIYTDTTAAAKCQAPKEYVWHVVSGMRLNAAQQTSSTVTLQTCMDTCAASTAYSCLSIAHNIANSMCYHYTKNARSPGVSFVPDTTGFTFYGWHCYTSPVNRCGGSVTQVWNAVANQELSGSFGSTLLSSDQTACETSCLQASSCLSVDFTPTSNTCWLNTATRTTTGASLSSAPGTNYLEPGCLKTAATMCTSPNQQYWYGEPGRSLQGTSAVTIGGVQTLSICQGYCKSLATSCYGVNYHSINRQCQLITVNTKNGLAQNFGWSFYKWECQSVNFPYSCSTGQTTWSDVLNRRLNSWDDKMFSNINSLASCRQLCLANTDFVCKSVEYNTNTQQCVLSSGNQQTASAFLYDATGYTYSDWRCSGAATQLCPTGQEVYWEAASGKILFGNNDLIQGVESLADCENRCANLPATQFQCRSIEYSRGANSCIMSRAAVEVTNTALVNDASYSYYRWACKTANSPACPSGQTVSWKLYSQRALVLNDEVIVSAVSTPEDCQNRCLNYKQFKCMSVEHNVQSQLCMIQSANSAGRTLTASTSDNFFEWTCSGSTTTVCPTGQYQVWTKRVGLILSGFDDKQMSATTLASCLAFCKSESSFACKSVEFSQTMSSCRLSASDSSAGQMLVDNQGYSHYQWHCATYNPTVKCPNSNNPLLWELDVNTKLSAAANSVLGGILERAECERRCVTATGFTCASLSFDSNGNICHLYSTTKATSATQNLAGYTYEQWKCDGVVPPTQCQPGENIRWNTQNQKKMLWQSETLISGIASIQTCRSRCLAHTAFKCLSINYAVTFNTCVLMPASTKTGGTLLVDANFVHEDWDCTGGPAAKCTAVQTTVWHTMTSALTLDTTYSAVVSGIATNAQCQETCLAQTTFMCTAIEYNSGSFNCRMFSKNRETPGILWKAPETGYVYSEWVCRQYTRTRCAVNEPLYWELQLDRNLNGVQSVTRSGIPSEMQCELECINDLSCQSFDFSQQLTTCELNRGTTNTGGANLLTDNTHNYLRWKCLTAVTQPTDRCPTGQQAYWTGYARKILQGNDDMVLSGVTDADACQSRCLSNQAFVCKSVEYNPSTKVCHLSAASTATALPVPSSSGFNLFEYTCHTTNPIACTSNNVLAWSTFAGFKLFDDLSVTRTGVPSPSACQSQCFSLRRFVCKAIEYNQASQTCRLQAHNSKTGTMIRDAANSGSVYQEWTCHRDECKDGEAKVWTVVDNKIMVEHDDELTTKAGVNECLNHCSTRSAPICRSAEFSLKTLQCRVSQWTDYSTGLVDDPNGYAFYQWKCRTYKPNVRCPTGKLIWNKSTKRVLSGQNYQTLLSVLDMGQCESRCVSDPTCRSLEYSKTLETCILQQVTKQSATLVTNLYYDYQEWSCLQGDENHCGAGDRLLFWSVAVGKVITGQDDTVQGGVTSFPECEQLCLNNPNYKCLSAEFSHTLQTCRMSRTAVDVNDPTLVNDASGFNYFMWNCRNVGAEKCPTSNPRIWKESLGSTSQTPLEYTLGSGVSLQACYTSCITFTGFQCLAIEHQPNTNRCTLIPNNKASGVTLTATAGTNYYEWQCGTVASGHRVAASFVAIATVFLVSFIFV